MPGSDSGVEGLGAGDAYDGAASSASVRASELASAA